MKILFHANTINYRGTTVAIVDYAKYNRQLLGNESIIAYNESLGYEKDIGTDLKVLTNLKLHYDVYGYKNLNQLQKIIDKHKIDTAYFIRAGNAEPLPTNTKTCVHSVFQFNEPHGDKYAYVSEWLSNKMSAGTIPFVPHVVRLPTPYPGHVGFFDSPNGYRPTGGKTVIGRIGGYETFDIPFVQEVVSKLARTDKFAFAFVGTKRFDNHKNILHYGETYTPGMKAWFMDNCDAMLHARQRGESFGLSIAEFLSCNRPVMAWNNGHDQNHMEMLKGSGLLYNNAKELEEMLWNMHELKQKEDWTKRVEQYQPIPVMNKFKEVFLT